MEICSYGCDSEENSMKAHIWLVVLSFWALSAYAGTIDVNLGTAGSFAVLAGSTATNTGSTVVDGDLGVYSSGGADAVTGFPPGVVNGTIYATGYEPVVTAMQAQGDLTTAYNYAAGLAPTQVLTGENLGGLTLTPGVYFFASTAELTGTLTLNAEGESDAVFVFQIKSALTTASDSSVVFENGGQGGSVFWQVGSSATLGTSTEFAGSILALTSITLNTDASITCGRALAQNGAVTMDANTVSINDTGGCEATTGGGTVPEPGTATLLSMGLLLGLMVYGRQSRKQAFSRR
jgi:hypothetical protein